MTHFLFVTGQIRAQESRLLTPSRLDRMVGAQTPEEAFRVLTELQYAQYFDEQVKAQDFNRIIEKGLLETKDLILRGTDNHVGFQFIWRRFDLNNLKRALKIKLLEGRSELGEFTEENGFSRLGVLSEKQIQEIVFEKKFPETLPSQYAKVLLQVEILLEQTQSFREVEFAFDRAHFSFLRSLVRKTHSSFLKNLFELTVDAVNFRSLVRSVLMLEEAPLESMFMPFGTFCKERFLSVENWEQFLKFSQQTRFFDLMKLISDTDSSEDKLMKIEKGIGNIIQQFLHSAQSGEISSIQVPLAYFERRLQNAQMLKFIMFAKFHGMTAEQIYATLKQF